MDEKRFLLKRSCNSQHKEGKFKTPERRESRNKHINGKSSKEIRRKIHGKWRLVFLSGRILYLWKLKIYAHIFKI